MMSLPQSQWVRKYILRQMFHMLSLENMYMYIHVYIADWLTSRLRIHACTCTVYVHVHVYVLYCIYMYIYMYLVSNVYTHMYVVRLSVFIHQEERRKCKTL